MIQEAIVALSAVELASLKNLQSKVAAGDKVIVTNSQYASMQKAYDAAKAAGKVCPELKAHAKKLGLVT